MTAVGLRNMSPEEMLVGACELITQGSDPNRLLEVAAAHRDKWARLVNEQDAGVQLDGRASIYTGETYAEARDRWETYRALLADRVGGATS